MDRTMIGKDSREDARHQGDGLCSPTLFKKVLWRYRSGEAFSHERFFSCGTQHKAVA